MKQIDLDKIFIIAELSANHNGSFELAVETIKAAKRAGADCIKLQTYTPDTITINSSKNDFIIKGGTLWDDRYLYDLYKEAFTPWEWHKELFKVAESEGLAFMSSPFDITAVDYLEKLGVFAYKIASFEITDIPLIEYIAKKGKLVIISTGIANLEDIELAIQTCKNAGNDQIALLKCTSSYPAPIEEANLAMIQDFAKRFDVIPGISDHTMGELVPILSVPLGAKIIEKHFILDRNIGGPDAEFSMNYQEFEHMVKSVRNAEKAIGKIDYALTDKQLKARSFSRSLYIVKDVKVGEVFSNENVRSIRPGYGLHPKFLPQILGKICNKDLEKGERMSFDHIQKE